MRPRGDPLQIGVKLVRGIGRQVQFLKRRRIQIGQKLTDFIARRKAPSGNPGMRKPRVAAELRLRRFSEHDDLRRARLLGGDRRLKSGAAAADYELRECFQFSRFRISVFGDSCIWRASAQFFLYRLWIKPELSSLFMNELSMRVSTRTSAIFGVELNQKLCSRFIPSMVVCGARS